MKKWLTQMALAISVLSVVFMLTACTQDDREGISSDPSNEYSSQELTFPVTDEEKTDNNKAIFEITPFSIRFELPTGWSVGEYDPQAVTYLYSGVWSRVGIYDTEGQCVGAIGYNTFEEDEETEGEPMAIYNQIALGNDYQFNVKNTYTVVSDSTTCETATVDVYYSPTFDNISGTEKTNHGILSYDSEKLVYVAFEFDCTSVSDEVIANIADSIDFFRNTTLIPLEEVKEQYDLSLYFPDFTFDEVEVEGVSYYQLTNKNKNKNISILINDTETQMMVSNQDNEPITGDILWFFPTPTSEIATITMMDVTNDGIDDLIYKAMCGGTGAYGVYCRVYDLENQKCYQVSDLDGADFIEQILSNITIEGIAVENDYALCQVTIPGAVAQKAGVNLEQGVTMDTCDFTVGTSLGYFNIWEENGSLYTSVSFSIKSAAPGFYLGSVDTQLEFDKSEGCFKPVEEQYLNIFNPEQ